MLEAGVFTHLKLVIDNVSVYEDAFREVMGLKHKAVVKKEIAAKRKIIAKSENRIKELDRLFTSIYEDKVNGSLTESRFQMLADQYEKEQEELKQKVETLSAEIEQQEQETNNVERFISKIRKYTDLQEMSPTVLNDLVKRVEVHKPEIIDGRRTQRIDIYYDFVGILPLSLLQSIKKNSIA